MHATVQLCSPSDTTQVTVKSTRPVLNGTIGNLSPHLQIARFTNYSIRSQTQQNARPVEELLICTVFWARWWTESFAQRRFRDIRWSKQTLR